jgi:hypothetical protein
MDAKVRSCDLSSPKESIKGLITESAGLFPSMAKSAPTRVFAWVFMSCITLAPSEKVAVSAAIPRTIEEMNNSKRARFLRESRQAIITSQEMFKRLGSEDCTLLIVYFHFQTSGFTFEKTIIVLLARQKPPFRS